MRAANSLRGYRNMAQSTLRTVALTNDNETETIAYNMGCGLVAIDQYDPTAKRTNTVILTEDDLAELRKLIG